MVETNGGGSAERVAGFNLSRALTAGFTASRVSSATLLAARPDGGFFSIPAESPGPPLERLFPATGKPENVIGIDDRVIVPETTLVPWRCICHLEITYDTGAVGLGTGWFMGPSTVITAGHCLYDRVGRRHAREVRVIPGRNGQSAPYGFVVSNEFHYPPEWKSEKADEDAAAFDYGAITIDRDVANEPFGERIGYFGLRCFERDQEQELKLLLVNNAGYPFELDKPYGTLWFNAGRVHAIGENYLEYMLDTEGGQSGSPVYVYDTTSGQRVVVAIHTTGNFVNRGLRITRRIFDQLSSWAKRDG